MTTDATGGYQPPGSENLGSVTGSGSSGASMGSGSGSTTGAAKEQAAAMGQTAKEKGTEVASTAADQAKNVAGEAKNQARHLLQETQTQVREQVGSQKEKATGGLRSISDELRSLADGTQIGQPSGMIADLARQASDKIQDIATWIESREPADVLEEVRQLARRKPGSFLLGAAAAGALAGRMTRGAVDAQRSQSSDMQSYGTTQPMYGGTGTGGTSTGQPWAGAGSTPGTGEDVLVVEETVVVETDPFGARPERSTVGGGRA